MTSASKSFYNRLALARNAKITIQWPPFWFRQPDSLHFSLLVIALQLEIKTIPESFNNIFFTGFVLFLDLLLIIKAVEPHRFYRALTEKP